MRNQSSSEISGKARPLNDQVRNRHGIWAKQTGCFVVLAGFALIGTTKAETWPATYHPPADRALAAEWLGELKAPTVIPGLIKLCADPDGGVRYSAVLALGI